MNKFKLGSKLKLTIPIDDINESADQINDEVITTPQNKTTLVERKSTINKGCNIEIYQPILKDNIISQANYFYTSPNFYLDYSYHWLDKVSNIKRISEPMIFKLNFSNGFKEPIRDLLCEYELLKLITEDEHHKNNFIEIPKSMKRLNRYSDVLPCKYKIIL